MVKKIIFFTILLLAISKDIYAQEETIKILSDESWLVAKDQTSNWELVLAPSEGRCNRGNYNRDFYPIWHPNAQQYETVYFRKEFDIESIPTNGRVAVGFDDDGEVFINGELLLSNNDGYASMLPEISGDDVVDLLQIGKNIITARVVDTSGGCQSFVFHMELDFTKKILLDVPMQKQTNPNWSDVEYDHGYQQDLFCGKTIRDCGCVTTSLSMLLNYHGATKAPNGEPTTPITLNNYLNENGRCSANTCVSQGYAYGNVVWSAINSYTKKAYDKFGTSKVMWRSGGEFDREKVEIEIQKENPTILQAPDSSHWFIATGIYGDTLTINDPFFDRQLLSHETYKNNASQMRLFEKVNSDFSSIEIVAKAPTQILATNKSGQRTGFDSAKGTIMEEINNSGYYFEESYSNPSDELLAKEGVYRLIIQNPEKGNYAIGVVSNNSTYNIAVYVSDRNANTSHNIFSGEIIGSEVVVHTISYDPEVDPNITPTPSPTMTPKKKFIRRRLLLNRIRRWVCKVRGGYWIKKRCD